MIRFKIPVGDWSNDGHGRCEWFIATADGTLADVRAAYEKGCQELPKEIRPSELFRNYEETTCSLDIAKKISDVSSIKICEDYDDGSGYVYCNAEDFIVYVVWVMNKGNPMLNVTLEDPIPTLTMSLGYGLLS